MFRGIVASPRLSFAVPSIAAIVSSPRWAKACADTKPGVLAFRQTGHSASSNDVTSLVAKAGAENSDVPYAMIPDSSIDSLFGDGFGAADSSFISSGDAAAAEAGGSSGLSPRGSSRFSTRGSDLAAAAIAMARPPPSGSFLGAGVAMRKDPLQYRRDRVSGAPVHVALCGAAAPVRGSS